MSFAKGYWKSMDGNKGGSSRGGRGGGRGGGRHVWGCFSNLARVSSPPTATSNGVNISRQPSLGVNNNGDSDQVQKSTAASSNSSSIQVKSLSGQSKRHQSDNPLPWLRKSDQSGKAPVSRMSKQKEVMTQPPKPPTSLFRSSSTGSIRISEPGSKQQPTATTQSRPSASSISSSSRIQEQKQTPKTPASSVENGRTSSTMQQQGSKTALQRKEATTQSPKNVGTSTSSSCGSRIQASMHSVQKKETTQSLKDSEAWVKKSETSRRVPIWKQSTQSPKGEKAQPGIGTNSGVVIKNSGAAITNPSKPVTRSKQISLPRQEQKQHTNQHHNAKPRKKKFNYRDYYAEHIEWEGFKNRIVPLGQSCLLCEKDLAYEPEYDRNTEQLNPAENAVLSCGHAFHNLCLQDACSEDNGRDPCCIICASLLP